ncbi:Esa1p-associated factor [Gnomoniopsis sp. IMI 355080]|nr:Esa1p-associated factor [Gnomoniopsis sp. IMI 355080]
MAGFVKPTMSRRMDQRATQGPAGDASKPSSSGLDIYDMSNWGDAFTSDWAKQETQWAKKAKTQGYSHFKTPQELGIMSEFAASKRYYPKLNKNGEWEQNAAGPYIHRPSDEPKPFKKPENPPMAGVPLDDRAAFNKELREQAAQYGERAPQALPRPAERRQRMQEKMQEKLREKQATATIEPTRKSTRIRAQPTPASAPAAMPPTAPDVVKSSAPAPILADSPVLDQVEIPADIHTSDHAVVKPSAPVALPTSTPAAASTSKAATFAVAAPVIHTTSATATDPVIDPVIPSSNAPESQGEPSHSGGSSTSTNLNENMDCSNGLALDNQLEEPVAPSSYLQGSTKRTIIVTWEMDAVLARKVQSILSVITSFKQENDSEPSKRTKTGQIATAKKRKAEDEGRAAKKRTRVQTACLGCKHWRVKCDGGTPCSKCLHRNRPCKYTEDEDDEDEDNQDGNDQDGDDQDDDDKDNAPDVVSTSKSAPKPSTSKAGPSGTKKVSAPSTKATGKAGPSGTNNVLAPSTTAAQPPKSAIHPLARGPSCGKCREKRTKCDRGRPCRICHERRWDCVYLQDTVDEPGEASEAGSSGSGEPGNDSSGSNQKNGHAASASSKQVHELASASTASAPNGAADKTNNLKRQREIDQGDCADEPAAKKSKTGRSVLPAITEWIVKGEHGFQDFQFNKDDCLTKRQMEKRVMVAEENKQDLTKVGTVTNDQRAQEESFHNRPSIKLVLPDHLKGFLVDDWENVTKNGLVVELPHSKATVDQILKDYVEYEKQHRQEGSAHMDILVETIEGLREYFDKALARILLYRFERLQWAEISKDWTPEQTPSTTYGAEHLCRLLVSLPELVAQTNMDAQSVSRLREELTKFTNWLEKRTGQYFLSEYINPGPDYADKARG